MSAPVDLETIKDDLGMPAGDTSNDAWLQRASDGVWARFEAYTARSLQAVGPWVDDWGEIAPPLVHHLAPPFINSEPRGTVFLRVFPVVSVASLTLNGTSVDPTRVVFDNGSGRIISLDGTGRACDCAPLLLTGRARVAYSAGFAQVPADLYWALVGALGPLWTARQSQGSGQPGVATRVSTPDAGEVEYSGANLFVDASTKRGNISDPMLGPYAMVLDPYVDWRSMIGGGGIYPTTRPGAPTP